MMARVPREAVERKPPHGSPCNRCGVCCMATQCDLSRIVFGAQPGACAALEGCDEGYRCGVAADPGFYAPVRAAVVGVEALREAALTIIYANDGCDARINGEPINQAYRLKNRLTDDPDKRRRALALFAPPEGSLGSIGVK